MKNQTSQNCVENRQGEQPAKFTAIGTSAGYHRWPTSKPAVLSRLGVKR